MRLKACSRCGSLPVMTSEQLSGTTTVEYNVGHLCPDGMVSRGARSINQDAAIKEWNRQQAVGKLSNPEQLLEGLRDSESEALERV